jgi:hypothetical protein
MRIHPNHIQSIGLGFLSVAILFFVYSGVSSIIGARGAPLLILFQESKPTEQVLGISEVVEIELPEFTVTSSIEGVYRLANVHTHIPERPTYQVTKYTVQAGDTAWSIGQKFGLRPESILWGNDWLSPEAASLRIGADLNILPVDGVLHTVVEGDTWERIQLLHGTPIEKILEFPGNDFASGSPPSLNSGHKIIVPGGRNPVVWIEPGPKIIPGLGRRSPGLYDGPLIYTGSGSFIWPIAPPYRLTQDFWPGHPAIDLGTYLRQPIFASDHGTVIFSGYSQAGYGNLVIIDHANSYWTYYAHNEANLVTVGQGVLKGQQIAESGSTGISTGNHIDFRIRKDGGSFLNPWYFLP